jgi:hypothetical protein
MADNFCIARYDRQWEHPTILRGLACSKNKYNWLHLCSNEEHITGCIFAATRSIKVLESLKKEQKNSESSQMGAPA